jgi:hypothetical protein
MEGYVQYSVHLDYLRLLIRHIGYSKRKTHRVAVLAKELSLEPDVLSTVLEGFPTVFRRLRAAGDPNMAPRSTLYRSWALRMRLPVKSAADEKTSYALQWPLNAALSADDDGVADRRSKVDWLIQSVERSAEVERADRRSRVAATIASVALILAALILSGSGQAVTGAGRSSPPVGHNGADVSGVGGDAGSRAGRARWGGPPLVNITCGDCPASAAVQPDVQQRDGGARDGLGSGWGRFLGIAAAMAIGLGLFVWAVRRRNSQGPAPLLSLGSVASFAGAVAAWAQPALTYKPGQAGLHNPTAAVLLTMLLFAGVMLVSGFVFRGRRLLWILPPALVAVVLVGVSVWPASSRANMYAGYLVPYLAASAPERLYAWMPILAGLIGLSIAAAIAHWLSRTSRPLGGGE